MNIVSSANGHMERESLTHLGSESVRGKSVEGALATFQVAFLTIPRGPCSLGHLGMVLGRRGKSRHLVPAEFGFSSGRLPHSCKAPQGPQWGQCAHLRRSKVGSMVGLKRPGEASQVGTRDPLGISSRLYTDKAVFSFILCLKT